MDAAQSSETFETVDRDQDIKDGGSVPYPLPQVEVKVSNKTLLIRLHCENKKGILPKIFSEVENYDLTVVNSSVMVFGTSALDITIVAEIRDESSMQVKDLVSALHSIL
ncbi:hypothetical protein vseg_012195 [Gypsophila vaccaria]